MTTKERILAIRLLEKAEKHQAFAAALGLSWKTQSTSPPTQRSSSLQV